MRARSESGLAFLSIEQAARLLRRKEISPVDLVKAALARIERLNPKLNAFITVVADRALHEARSAERKLLRKGLSRDTGPLFGIPISLKDNYFTRGVRTTAGSKILRDFVPPEDSEVAARLASAGAILVGKTNMHEFAYGITSENPHYGPARNPWARDRITGGSSGGSAAAVAAGMGFASMGTDTGGSIRIPAAMCGIVGLKPTFGLVSVEGIVPLALSLDHAGPLARSVRDIRVLLDATSKDCLEGTVRRPEVRKLRLSNRSRGFVLGWPKHYYFERVDTQVRRCIDAAVKVFESLGARIEEVSLPHLADSADPSTNIAMAEATQYHEQQGYFPARAQDYSDDVRHRLERGREVRAVDYIRAFDAKRLMNEDFDAAFKGVDATIAPGSPIAAPHHGEQEVEIAGERETVRSAVVRVNRPANLSGHPAISIPCGFTGEGLPVGLQLIGPRWSEPRLLAIAAAYEDATEWHTRHPELA